MSGYDTALEDVDSNFAGITHDVGIKGPADFLATIRRRATRIIRNAPRAFYDMMAFLLKSQEMSPSYFTKQVALADATNLEHGDVTHEGISRTLRNAIAGAAFLYAARGINLDAIDAPSLVQQLMQRDIDDAA